MQVSKGQLAYTLGLLFAINFMNFYDRQIIGAVGEPIKIAFELSDKQLSALTTAFVLLYALVGLPLGHWADVGRRNIILAVGVIVWSMFTVLSGFAGGFASLFIYRLGVGVGEASCAPAGNSLLGDLFPPQQRARALSVFMLGLPLGLGASYVVSGIIAKNYGWEKAFFVAAVPGFILGVLALWLPEPTRGGAEQHAVKAAPRSQGSAIRTVLRVPTMWWIIASGALLNLNMYALGSFLTSFLMRYHKLDIDYGNRVNSVVYGFGGMGILLGGWLGDWIARKRVSGRLELAAAAMLIAAPCIWFALEQPRLHYLRFAALMLPGCLLLYVYYSTVYATIQDVVEPAQRGTAMAVYFFVFYIFTAIGLYVFGWLSDYLATRAAMSGLALSDLSVNPTLALVTGSGAATVVAFQANTRAHGLHDAMYVLPIITSVLIAVLWAGSRTVARDNARLKARLEAEAGKS